MQSRLLPAFHFFRRQRQKEFRADFDLPFPRSGLALTSFVLNRDQAHNRLLAASDDDLFTPACLLNQPRKLGLGPMDGNGFHKSMLAKYGLLSQDGLIPRSFARDISRSRGPCKQYLKPPPNCQVLEQPVTHPFARIICSACFREVSVSFAPDNIRATSSVRSSPLICRTVVFARPAVSRFSIT